MFRYFPTNYVWNLSVDLAIETFASEFEGMLLNAGGDLRCYLRDGDDVFQTYETTARGVEAMLPTLQLLDLTAYGRQEAWEDSPAGWPQGEAGAWWWRDGRPVAQWLRPPSTR